MTDNGQANPVKQAPKGSYPQALARRPNTASQKRGKAKPSAFDYQFRRHVLPDLQRAAQRLAFAVHHGADFAEALNVLTQIAFARRAAKLSDPDGLVDYLTEYLAACCERPL